MAKQEKDVPAELQRRIEKLEKKVTENPYDQQSAVRLQGLYREAGEPK